MPFKLFWEKAAPGNQVQGRGDHATILKTLVETFGRDPRHPLCPVELGRNHVFTLRTLASGEGGTVYGELADLIDVYGKLRLWGVD